MADGLITPEGVAVDAKGNIYVAEELRNRIFQLTTDGTKQIIAHLAMPSGVAVDCAGAVYASGAGGLLKILSDGTTALVKSFLLEPVGIAVAQNGDVYLTGVGPPGRVVKLARNGLLSTVGHGFVQPVGIAVDSAGNAYIVDETLANVFKVEPSGKTTALVRKQTHRLINSAGVAVGSDGRIFVTDGYGVWRLFPSGRLSLYAVIPSALALAIDRAGNLYVTNYGPNGLWKVAPP